MRKGKGVGRGRERRLRSLKLACIAVDAPPTDMRHVRMGPEDDEIALECPVCFEQVGDVSVTSRVVRTRCCRKYVHRRCWNNVKKSSGRFVTLCFMCQQDHSGEQRPAAAPAPPAPVAPAAGVLSVAIDVDVDVATHRRRGPPRGPALRRQAILLSLGSCGLAFCFLVLYTWALAA